MDHHQPPAHLLKTIAALTVALLAVPATARALPPLEASASVGAPGLLSLEAALPPRGGWQPFASGGYSLLPIPGRGDLFSAGHVEAGLRWQPWESSAFFVSGALGYQSLAYSTELPLSSLSAELGSAPASITFNALSLYPMAGFLWRKPSGFLIGFDVGLQIPVLSGGGVRLTQPPASAADLAASLQQSSSGPFGLFSSLVIPRVTFIRVGWLW